MKIQGFKKFSLVVLSVLFMMVMMPSLSARHYSSFSVNLNLSPRPAYTEYYVPVAPAPAYVVRPYAAPVYPVYASPAYGEVVVQRPYVERVHVHPHYCYWR